MEDVLKCYMKGGQTATNRQLEIIIKMLNTPSMHCSPCYLLFCALINNLQYLAMHVSIFLHKINVEKFFPFHSDICRNKSKWYTNVVL